MARGETKYIGDLKKQIARDRARRVRKAKREAFKRVMAKEKVDRYGDIFDIFCGLSRKAVELAAIARIRYLAVTGYSPEEIIELMEVGKGGK